jgi:hypothetical protein
MSRDNPSPPDRPPGTRSAPVREVIFEFTRVGDQIKVAAVDPASGAEAVIFGPASAAQADLERLALNKLRYLGGRTKGAPPPSPPRPGRLV